MKRRFLAALGAGLAGVLILTPLIDLGVVPVAFAATSEDSRMSFTDLSGDGFELAPGPDGAALGSIRTATAGWVCQSRRVSTPFGSIVLRTTAGTPADPVRIDGLTVDLAAVDGADVTLGGAELGVDASTLAVRPGGLGVFGGRARGVHFDRLSQHGAGAGVFHLTRVSVTAGPDVREC